MTGGDNTCCLAGRNRDGHSEFGGKRRAGCLRRFPGRPQAPPCGQIGSTEAVEGYVENPDAWKAKLENHLKDAGVDKDQDVLAAAALVIQRASQDGQVVGKYVVNNAGSTGNQFGDGNTQTFNFGSSSR